VKVSYISSYGKAGDWLWDSKDLTIWTVQECCVGIVAGNLPCLKPLFRSMLSLTGYGSGSRSRSRGNSKSAGRGLGFPGNSGYGKGSAHHRQSIVLKSLSSGNTSSDETKGVAGDEAQFITHITARSVNSDINVDDSDKMSDDSIEAMAQGRIAGNSKGHGAVITKTTTTKVEYETGKERRQQDLAPERKVEYQV
jgi:hypothetical protein